MARGKVKARAAMVGRAVALALALALLAVSACGRTGSAAAGPRPATPTGVAKWTQAARMMTPTLTPVGGQPLPAFADWRAAYFGADGVLHAVTLDGKTDLAGPRLPGLEMAGLNFASAGVSPDGHTLAYATDSINIVDVTGRHPSVGESDASAYLMFWSPEGTHIALGDNVGGYGVENAADGASRVVPGTRPSWSKGLDGWIDATHILIDGVSGTSKSFILAALDVATGQTRPIAALPISQNMEYLVTLSPDGREALFYSRPWRDYPFTPTADVIDTATGAVRALPSIAPLTAGMFYTFAWRPGSHTVAVTTNQLGAPTWLLNLDADSAAPVALYQSVGSVAGWSPDGTTLIFSTGYQLGVGSGPYTISAVSLASGSGAPRVTVLTRSAMSFPFVGFIRTA